MTDRSGEGFNDCWNKIGVWARGKKDCPELEHVVHCANCDVFSAAGRRLLDTDAPAGYLEKWAQFFSQPQKIKQHDSSSVVLFRLGDEWFALPSVLMEEVVSVRAIHRVPHRKSEILKGLINIRGELQVCVSVGRLLHISKGDISGTNIVKGIYERMIVIKFEGARYVFPVSEVRGVHRYTDVELKHAPATIMNCSVHYLKGMLMVDKKHVGLIDHELLFPALDRGIM